MKRNQLEVSDKILELTKNIPLPTTTETLIILKDRIYANISIRPYDDSTKNHEKEIRWKRTATQILEDGFVYDGKFCTDIVIVFLAACNALNLETRFVKLKKEKYVHSVAEVKLDNDWYNFDVSNKTSLPIKGEITLENPYKDWQLWKKGHDAWDLELTDFDSIKKITL